MSFAAMGSVWMKSTIRASNAWPIVSEKHEPIQNSSQPLSPAFEHGHNHSLPTCHSDNPLLQAAFRTQQSIGWENCTRGFLALEWRATQQRYQESLLHDQYFSTKRWVSTLIQSLWDVAWDQWDYRNSVLHSPKHRPHQLLVQQLDAAISQEYQHGHCQLPPSFRPLFRIPLPLLLNKSVRYRQHWLHNVETARYHTNPPFKPAPSPDPRPTERSVLQCWLQTGRVTF